MTGFLVRIRKKDDPEMNAEEEAEIYAILNGDAVHELADAEEISGDEVEVKEESEVDPARALAGSCGSLPTTNTLILCCRFLSERME